MRAVDIIERKRDNKELSTEEISFLLSNYLDGNVPDYQIAAFLMAVYFNGMSDAELLEFELIGYRREQRELKIMRKYQLN